MLLLPRFSKLFASLIATLFSSRAFADYTLNMSPGVTPISRDVYELHMTIFWICVAIGVAVFSVMFYAIILHRKSRGAVPAQFHESTIVEIIWTVIPLAILVFMAIPAAQVLFRMENVDDSELSVKVTGYMWHWQYDYIGEDVKFVSKLSTPEDQIINRDIKNDNYLLEVDNPLVLPINKKIRILTTANDVIHSFWVPEFAVKKDAIPGFINEAWVKIEQPGTYRGQCAELCGARHGYMPIVVEAKTETEFEEWLQSQKSSG